MDEDDDVASFSNSAVDPEDLPSLLYQMTNLCRKCDDSTNTLKSKVVEALSMALDGLLDCMIPEIETVDDDDGL